MNKQWHSKEYNRLINCQQWRNLRNWYLSSHPECERCLKDGIHTIAECVHHITPVEDGRSKSEMAALAYNPSNLMALCITCHTAIHKEAGQKTSAKLLERKVERAHRAYAALFGEDPRGGLFEDPSNDSNPPANLETRAR